MSAPLRPLTTGELLDRTFNLYRNNFALFAGIASIASITVVGASVFLMALGISLPKGPNVDPRTLMGPLMVNIGVFLLFSLVGVSLATGATIYSVSRVHLDQTTSISDSYRKVFPKLGRIILITLAIVLRIILMAVLLFVGMFVSGFIVGLIVSGAGKGAASIVFGVFIVLAMGTVYFFLGRLYFKYSLSVQACMLENTRVNDSLNRSSFLTQDSLWRIFLIYLLMAILGFVLNLGLAWPAEVVFKSGTMAAIIWQQLATFVAYTLSFPISTIAISLVYYDQRVRKEAFDLQLMMESLGQGPDQAVAAPLG